MTRAGATDCVAVARGEDGVPRLQRRARPSPSGNEVVLRVLAAAVCGTDRQILRGERRDIAAILGHEGAAEVTAIGPAVCGIAIGERFVFNPVDAEDQDVILGHSHDGLFQQFVCGSQAAWTRRALLVPLPDRVPLAHAVLAEPLGTVVYTHELLDAVRRPRSLLVVGAGPIAILHALYAQRCLGLADVRIVCRSASRARWLGERGLIAAADLVADAGQTGDRFDAVVLATPARATAAALRAALPHVADGGTIALVAGIAEPHLAELPGLDLQQLRRANVCGRPAAGPAARATCAGRTIHLLGHRGTAPRHLARALEALREPFWGGLFSHRIPIEALPEALLAIAAGEALAGAHYVKGLVDVTATDGAIETFTAVAS